MEESTVALAVADVLPADQRRDLLDYVYRNNPSLRGAPVADVLSIYAESDAAIDWTERAHEHYGMRLLAMLPAELSDDDKALIARYSILAAALIVRFIPAMGQVLAIAKGAIAALEEYR